MASVSDGARHVCAAFDPGSAFRSALAPVQDDMDLAIAIRRAVVKDGRLYVQVGAGIVHDSVPESEWQETQNKAKAVLRAAEMVQSGLDTDG
jgi:anthranilate/para-aminobenzoate synthase component I